MRANKIILAVVASLGVTTAAMADTNLGWYAAGDGGGHKLSTKSLSLKSVKLTSRTATSSGSSSSSSGSLPEFTPAPIPDESQQPAIKTKSGLLGFARLGYRFTPHLRSELELGHREANLTSSLSSSQATGTGSIKMNSAMFNLLYDFAPDRKLHPFVGVGVGAVNLDGEYAEVFVPTEAFTDRSNRIDSKATFAAYQGIAGLSWKISEGTRLDVTYRYFEAPKARFDTVLSRKYLIQSNVETPCTSECDVAKVARSIANSATTSPETVNWTIDEKYSGLMSGRVRDQAITVGLRFSFGGSTSKPPVYQPNVEEANTESNTPAPQPKSINAASSYGPAAPGSVKPRQFNVYFNFDSNRLDSNASATIKDAAAYANDNHASSVLVTGHADTSGSKAYNVALSKRRATVVATELVTQGVPKPIITTSWKGEAALEVPTQDGVALRQNRRATIEVKF